MALRLSRFRKAFVLDGQTISAEHETFVENSRSSLSVDGSPVAHDNAGKDTSDMLRNHVLRWTRPDGRVLEVEIGPATTWNYGLRARLDGEIVHDTHPGKPLSYGPKMQSYMQWAETQNTPEAKSRNQAAMKRNWPSLAVDVVLAIAFFLVAREFGLVTAAVGGAVAGIVLWIVQKIIKVDLLGGLAGFGIVMGLLSAAFATVFKDDSIIQHRSTILGVIGAVPFLLDGMTGGQRLSARMARYFAFSVDAGRLGIAMGVTGLAMAGMNALAVLLLSQDMWLIYSTFIDVPIAMIFFVSMLFWAHSGPNARNY